MMTSEGNWLVGRKLLHRNGFEAVDRAPPGYELQVKCFTKPTTPSFPTDWDRRAKRFGEGLTVVRTDQCPYLEDAAETAIEVGSERGLKTQVVELTSAREVREISPSPYGVFSIVLDGEVLSHFYQPKKKLIELLDARTEASS
jgi:hypothetical protein